MPLLNGNSAKNMQKAATKFVFRKCDAIRKVDRLIIFVFEVEALEISIFVCANSLDLSRVQIGPNFFSTHRIEDDDRAEQDDFFLGYPHFAHWNDELKLKTIALDDEPRARAPNLVEHSGNEPVVKVAANSRQHSRPPAAPRPRSLGVAVGFGHVTWYVSKIAHTKQIFVVGDERRSRRVLEEHKRAEAAAHQQHFVVGREAAVGAGALHYEIGERADLQSRRCPRRL